MDKSVPKARSSFRPEWLESFMAVVEFGSFSEAATQLHSSQSRVSNHVAQLEDAVGQVLLDRQRRPVLPTEAGTLLLAHARRVLQAMNDAVRAFDADGAGTQGTVVLGTHPSIGANYVPSLFSRLRTIEPGIRIDLAEQTTTQLSESLRARTIDVAIRAMVREPGGRTVAAVPLWREKYYAVVPQDELDPDVQSVDPSFLADRDLIVIARPGAYVDQEFAAAFNQAGLLPRISGRTAEPMTLVHLVREGLGLGVLNELAARAFSIPGVRMVPIDGLGEGRVVGLCWDITRPMSDATRRVAHAILTHPTPADVPALVAEKTRDATPEELDDLLRTAAIGALTRARTLGVG